MQQHFYAHRNSFAAFLVLLLVSTASILRGQTLYIGANNGDWLTATNWQNGLPSATNAPTISGGAIVNINGTLTIDYVVQNFGTIINVGTTTVTTGNISSGGALENRGTLTVNAGGSVTSSGGMLNSGTFNNAGNVNSNSAWTNAATGVLNNSAMFMQLAPMTNDGSIAINGGQFTSPQAITNNKTISVAVGAKWVIDFGGSFQNLVGSTLTIAGTFQNLGTFTNNTTVTNTGTFNNNGAHTCNGVFNNENLATLESTGTFNLTGRVNNKVGAKVINGFNLNILAAGFVSNLATFTNNGQVNIALGGTLSSETGATLALGAGSKVTNNGYLKIAVNSSATGSGELNNTEIFDNYGSILSAGGGKVINSDRFINYGLIKDVNILDNSGVWKNAGTIENNNGATFTNTGTIENMVGGKITNNYDIFNKPSATFTNNGVLINSLRLSNEGALTNNAYFLTTGDVTNKAGSTLTNNELIEVREGSITNLGTWVNTKTIVNSNCSVISNKGTINNTGSIDNQGIAFQRGTLTGNAIVATSGWIQTGATSAAAICRTSLRAGNDVIGEAKVYGQNPLLPELNLDACNNFQYSVDNQTRAVYLCAKVGQTFSVPFRLLTRTGDSLTCSIPITVFDGVPPVVNNCPSSTTILTDANSATYTWPTITATDNCSPTSTIVSTVASGASFNLGTTEVVVTARDANNNAGDCRFNVTVQKIVATGVCSATDVTPPVFSNCPANINVTSTTGGRIVVWTPPSVSDACLPITMTSDASPGQFCPAGTKTVTYTAKDAKGNTSTCSFTITVSGTIDPCLTDAIKPVITGCPSSVFATTNTTINGAVAIWRAPSATDNCGFVNLTSTANSGSTFPVGATNVVYTATDAKNNASTCTFTVTVAATNPCAGDVTAPALTCPATVIANTTTNTATATWTVPTPTDACAGGVTLNGTHAPGSIFGLDTTRVTYVATDKVGNRSTCTFVVLVKNACFSDTTRPVIAGCPVDQTKVQVGGSATATWTAPTATDNCSTASLYSNYVSGAAFPLGTSQVVYTAVDEKGNAATCKFNITVQVATTASCAGNILLNPSFENAFTNWATYDAPSNTIVNDATSGAYAAKLASPASGGIFSQQYPVVGGTYNFSLKAKVQGTVANAVGVDFYDAAGAQIPTARVTKGVTNTTYADVTFTAVAPANAVNFAVFAWNATPTGALFVDDYCASNLCTNDVTPPVFTGCPANITINGTGTATTGIATWTAPVASDNCSTPAVVANYTSGQSFPVGATTVTYTATDKKGLTAVCSFTVTFVNACATDVTPPSFGTTCPSNKTGTSTNGLCVPVNFIAPTATDNCSTPTVSGTAAADFCFPIGTTTVIYTAADAKNNKATCTFTVTISGTATGNACATSSPTGGITREYFANITNNYVSPVVVPTTAPTTTTILTSFVAPQNVADNYIQRIRGFLRPSVSGNYTFYVTGDDNSDLYLSTSTNPATKTRIAFIQGYTINDDLYKYPSQKSAVVALVAGQTYYIEATEQEGGGGDNLAAYWVTPTNATPVIIPGTNLIPFCTGSTVVCAVQTNLALNKPATQASNYSATATANKAVDGNTDGLFYNNSVTHTLCGNQDWWQVDLGAVSNISQVKLWNRTDCCADRLNNSYLIVSDAPFATNDLTTLRNTAGVFVISIASVAVNATIDVYRTGRYVRVQLGGVGCLSLAEVQVFGCAAIVDPCVAAPSVGGTVSPALQSICVSATLNTSGFVPTLHTLSGQTGAIVRWEYQTPGSTVWNNWASTTTNAPNNCCFYLVGNWKVRAIVKNGACAEVPSSEAVVAVTACPVSPCSGGLQASYFNNTTLSGTPVVSRIDQTINFDWGSGSPDPKVNIDQFSARWTGQLYAPVTGTYTFTATVDDGFRLYVGGILLIDKWFDQPPTTYTQAANLTAGSTYDVRIEYYENGGVSVAKFGWSYPGVAAQPVPASYLCSNPCTNAGSIIYERWNNYTTTNFNLPVQLPTIAPSISQTQGNTQGFWNIGDNYLTRVRGYIKPTTTGVYSFNLTGDDTSELYLSTSSSSASMVRIASISGWTTEYDYTKYASQTSANITLQAGQLYYFEMRQVEAGGGDGWNIFWKTPTNATWQIIPSQNLARPCFNNIFAATSNNLFTFAAKADINQAKLQWVSNGGLKNDYYEVERANDLGNFEKLGTVNGSTGKTEAESFTFTDVNPLEGDNFYRIKTVENNGTIKFSSVETVTFSKNTEGVRLFPNPANDYVDVDLKKYDGLQVTITVYNQFGKLLQTAQIERASTAPFRLEFGDVATGSYMIRVQAQGKKEVVRKLQIVK
jgi:hypothetical protein